MTQITTKQFLKMKQSGERIAMVTAYDYPTAALLDEAGIHALLIGDSLGMVVQGNSTTVPVTLDDMVYHTRMVARATKHAMVVADMPFMSYHTSIEETLKNAARLMQEGNAHAVKLEGGAALAPTIERLVSAGIPVMGHLGLLPQSVHAIGGFAVQGRSQEAAKRLLTDANILEDAGAFSIVLEMVPAEVAAVVTASLSIPTIGIGAGQACDGQVLVFHDMTGYTSGYIPKHNKRYANLADIISTAARAYVAEVQSGTFPTEAQTIRLREDEAHILTTMNEENLR